MASCRCSGGHWLSSLWGTCLQHCWWADTQKWLSGFVESAAISKPRSPHPTPQIRSFAIYVAKATSTSGPSVLARVAGPQGSLSSSRKCLLRHQAKRHPCNSWALAPQHLVILVAENWWMWGCCWAISKNWVHWVNVGVYSLPEKEETVFLIVHHTMHPRQDW